MTSIGTFAKQIPLNNGYFRVVPALVATTAVNGTGTTPTPISSFMYTFNSGVLGGFTPPNAAVQVVDSGTVSTDGVGGTASGLDSDYEVAYIQLGLKGNAVPGPFIRTG